MFKTASPSKLFAALLLAGFSLSAISHAAVLTNSVGFVDVTIAGSSNGTTYATTPFAAVLLNPPTMTGKVTGSITGVTTNTISNASAGWTTNSLAVSGSPNFVKVNTGSAAGRMFLITANTANTLTLDNQGINLTTLGIQAGSTGDGYEIVQGETLLSLVGTPADGVVGGTATLFNSNKTDKVVISDSTGAGVTYYYDTSVSKWTRPGSSADQGNLVISPQAGLAYYRIAKSSMSITFTGNVPATKSQRQIAIAGTTIMASYFPVDSTLSTLALNLVPGWRKLGDAGVKVGSTDRAVLTDSTGVVRSYYYDATSGVNCWKVAGSTSNQNSAPVTSGSAIYCTRAGTGTTSQTWVNNMPYTL